MQPRLEYCAPEIVRTQLSGEAAPFSFASDFWSLGCLIYRMFYGSQLFSGSSPDAIRAAIISSADAVPMKTTKSSLPTSSRTNAPSPSVDLLDLLSRLLRKDHVARITWPELIRHPFWHGALNALLAAPPPGSGGSELLSTGAGAQQSISQDAPVSLTADGKPLANGNALMASRSFDLTSNSTLKPTTNEPSHAQAQRGEGKQVMLLTGAAASEPLTANNNPSLNVNANQVAAADQSDPQQPQRPATTSLRSLESNGTYFEDSAAAAAPAAPSEPKQQHLANPASASKAAAVTNSKDKQTSGSPPQELVALSAASSRKPAAQAGAIASSQPLGSSRTAATAQVTPLPFTLELLFYEPGVPLGHPPSDEAKAKAAASSTTGTGTGHEASCASAVGSTFPLIRSQLTRLFSIKYDPKTLPVTPYASDKLHAMPEKERDKFFQSVSQALKHAAGPPPAKKMHLLSYLIGIYLSPSPAGAALADVNAHLALSLSLLSRGQVLGDFLKELRDAASSTAAFPGGNQDYRTRVAVLLALIVGTAAAGLFAGRDAQQQTLAAAGAIDFGVVQSLVNLLVEQLRDQLYKNLVVRFGYLCAICELVCFVETLFLFSGALRSSSFADSYQLSGTVTALLLRVLRENANSLPQNPSNALLAAHAQLADSKQAAAHELLTPIQTLVLKLIDNVLRVHLCLHFSVAHSFAFRVLQAQDLVPVLLASLKFLNADPARHAVLSIMARLLRSSILANHLQTNSADITKQSPSQSAAPELVQCAGAVIAALDKSSEFVTLLVELLAGVNARLHERSVTLLSAMFATSLSQSLTKRLLPKMKDFLQRVFKLLSDSSSPILKGKLYLLVMQLLKCSPQLLVDCCQLRLVFHLERDSRRLQTGATPGATARDRSSAPTTATGSQALAEDSPDAQHFLHLCLEQLIAHLVDVTPSISKEITDSLAIVLQRKHPSQQQLKFIKSKLPFLNYFLFLLNSQRLRQKLIGTDYFKFITQLFEFLGAFERHSSGAGTAASPTSDASPAAAPAVANATPSAPLLDATLGQPGAHNEFITVCFTMLDSLMRLPSLMLEHSGAIVECLLPALLKLFTTTSAPQDAVASAGAGANPKAAGDQSSTPAAALTIVPSLQTQSASLALKYFTEIGSILLSELYYQLQSQLQSLGLSRPPSTARGDRPDSARDPKSARQLQLVQQIKQVLKRLYRLVLERFLVIGEQLLFDTDAVAVCYMRIVNTLIEQNELHAIRALVDLSIHAAALQRLGELFGNTQTLSQIATLPAAATGGGTASTLLGLLLRHVELVFLNARDFSLSVCNELVEFDVGETLLSGYKAIATQLSVYTFSVDDAAVAPAAKGGKAAGEPAVAMAENAAHAIAMTPLFTRLFTQNEQLAVLLVSVLKTIYALVKYLWDQARSVLEARRTQHSASKRAATPRRPTSGDQAAQLSSEQVEQLLQSGRPLAVIMEPLMALICILVAGPDSKSLVVTQAALESTLTADMDEFRTDLLHTACNVLGMLAQLFGGDFHLLDSERGVASFEFAMRHFTAAYTSLPSSASAPRSASARAATADSGDAASGASEAKILKLLLRYLRRVLSTDEASAAYIRSTRVSKPSTPGSAGPKPATAAAATPNPTPAARLLALLKDLLAASNRRADLALQTMCSEVLSLLGEAR